MKRKVIIGLAVLIVAATPVSVYAYEVRMRDTVNIYGVSDQEDHDATVSTFDDSGNKCYVVRGNYYRSGDTVAISCVRMR